jgi:hypothetical protein
MQSTMIRQTTLANSDIDPKEWFFRYVGGVGRWYYGDVDGLGNKLKKSDTDKTNREVGEEVQP